MGTPTTKTEVLLTILKEINKKHTEYDGLNRPSIAYTARIGAITGTPCHVIDYIYYGLTSVVKGRKEGYGTWQSTFDGDQALLTDDLFNELTDNLGDQLVGL